MGGSSWGSSPSRSVFCEGETWRAWTPNRTPHFEKVDKEGVGGPGRPGPQWKQALKEYFLFSVWIFIEFVVATWKLEVMVLKKTLHSCSTCLKWIVALYKATLGGYLPLLPISAHFNPHTPSIQSPNFQSLHILHISSWN